MIVRYRPEVEVSEVFVHKKEGDEAELVCSVHAYPTATVRICQFSSLASTDFCLAARLPGQKAALLSPAEKGSKLPTGEDVIRSPFRRLG